MMDDVTTEGTRAGDIHEQTRVVLSNMAELLDASGQYRVLHRMKHLAHYGGAASEDLRCAIILDTETTGLIVPGSASEDIVPSEVISLAMVAVAFRPEDGEILGVIDAFHRYRQPSYPIPPEVIALHGIDDATVKGCRIGAADIEAWMAGAVAEVHVQGQSDGGRSEQGPLLIAHNARFDRRMVEAHWPEVFAALPWACSQTQVPWAEYGYEGTKLFYLAAAAGFFYQRHDALDDTYALVQLLRQTLDGVTAMKRLLLAARETTHRVFAIGAPYDKRQVLKARSYRWSGGEDGRPRAWWIDCNAEKLETELSFLAARILKPTVEPLVRTIGPHERFSCRE